MYFQILLATNFFVHFGMDNATPSEYDTDIMLEYEEIETYKQFKEFFYDVLEEFEKFGKVVMFKVRYNFTFTGLSETSSLASSSILACTVRDVSFQIILNELS